MTMIYPLASLAADPPSLYPDYVGTRLRAPKQPLVIMPHTLSELTGPVYGHESVLADRRRPHPPACRRAARRAHHRHRARHGRGRPAACRTR